MRSKADWLDSLPPVVRIVLENHPREARLSELHKQVKGMLPELRKQALWTVENQSKYYVEHAGENLPGLIINPASGLDPFSGFGKCPDIGCRLKNADEIARTVGLYADVAVVGDPFTDYVLLRERWTEDDTMHFLTNFMVFARLAPLFRADVFRFANNFSAWCKPHLAQFETQIETVSEKLEIDLLSNVRVEAREKHLVMHTDGVLGTPYLYGIPRTKRGKTQFARGHHEKMGRKLFSEALRSEVRETLFHMQRSAHLGAITFSNSRASLLAARAFEAFASPRGQSLESWEARRSADLPWLGNIEPSQVLSLRNDAHRALPRFRDSLRAAMRGGSDDEADKVVTALRKEALEVKSELDALDVDRENRFRSVSSVLAMTVSVYGFATDIIPAGAALTGLLSLFGLLHTSQHKERQEIARLTSQPGYVLLRAKELTEHA